MRELRHHRRERAKILALAFASQDEDGRLRQAFQGCDRGAHVRALGIVVPLHGAPRRDELDAVLDGIDAAVEAGLDPVKINVVAMRGVNEDEIESLVHEAARLGAEIRFIEYMDVGGATRWTADQVFSRADVLASLTRSVGAPVPLREEQWAPAARFRLPDGQVIGIISSTTEPFCATCDRSRLTADGMWYRCLYAASGTDLRAELRGGATDEQLRQLLVETWRARADQGAEDRLRVTDRHAFVPITSLRRDPHLEMHTRGG